LLLAVPAGCALLIGAWQIQSRLAHDRTAIFWIRAGAAAGLAALAAQSVWDTGVRMPANGVLLVIVAAMALHEPHRPAPR
jgi:hypothetical protein